MSTHWLTVLSLAITLFNLVSAQDNQCFWAANERAGSIIVPCSSSGSYASCCQLGDLCLSDSACWNPQHNVTYLYGCTDSTYKDYHCPYKCGASFTSAPYVGLDYCSNTTNLEWSCTHPPNNEAAIQAFDYAAPCLDDSIIAFAGPVSLPPYLSLPSNIGGSTLYFSPTGGSYIPVTGYTPTTTAQVTPASVPASVEYVGSTATTTTSSSLSSASPTSASPTSTSTSTTSTTSTSATSTSATSSTTSLTSTSASSSAPPTTSSNSSTPLTDNGKPASSSNTGLKVGLGVGIAGGVLFLAALILFFLMWRRRRQRHAAIPQHETDDSGYGAQHEKNNATRYQDSPAGLGHSRGPSELSASNVDTYRNPAKPVGSPNIGTSSHTSPVPLYSEFEGSPVPAPHSSAAPQRYEMGDSR